MYVCICNCMCMHVCMYTHKHTHLNTHTHTHTGLVGYLGYPNDTDPLAEMYREHCEYEYSKCSFTTTNYGKNSQKYLTTQIPKRTCYNFPKSKGTRCNKITFSKVLSNFYGKYTVGCLLLNIYVSVSVSVSE